MTFTCTMSASSSFLRLPISLTSLGVAVTLVAIGCGGKADEPTTSASETNANEGAQTSGGSASGTSGGSGSSTASKECANKACGVDCTPEGSDEPFNCNSAGRCVATGQALGCAPKVCAPFVGDCIKGMEEADLDGDGCIDGCKPKSCPPFLGDCRQGDEPADLDGDGCTDGCKPIGSK